MPTNKHNLLLHRTFQYTTIVLIMAAMGGGYWYFKQAQAGLNINTNQEGMLSNGLVGYWPFDGKDISGTTAYDRSKSENNGTLTNGPTKTIGRVGQALSFDGTDDYVELGSFTGVSGATQASISAWLKINTLDSTDNIAVHTGDNGEMQIGVSSGNKFYFYAKLSNGSWYGVTASSLTLSAGQWYHVIAKWTKNSSIELYVNGVSQGTTAVGNFNLHDPGTDYTFTIGATDPLSAKSNYFPGSIDEVRIYDRAFSASEIWDLYQMGAADKVNSAESQGDSLEKGMVGYWKLDDASGTSAADASGNANTGTLTNGPTWTTGQIGGATNFDGTDDYIATNDVNALDGLSSLTVSAWANADALTQDKTIFSKSNSSADGDRVQLALGGTGYGGPNDVTLSIGDASNQYAYTTGDIVSTGVWSHYVMVFDGTQTGNANRLKLYKNGIQQALTFGGGVTIPATTSASNAGIFQIGAETNHVTSNRYWDGFIDEIRVYNRPLGADEIVKLYKTTVPDDPDTGLVGYWPFNGPDITGTTAYDRSGSANNGTLTNSPTKAIGKVGQALSFNGTNQYARVTNASALNPTTYVSASMWVKVTSPPGQFKYLLSKGAASANPPMYGFFNNVSGDLQFIVTKNLAGTYYSPAKTASAIYDNTWHYITGVYDGSYVRLYVDGIEVGSGTAMTGSIGTHANDLFIGSYDATTGYFPGIFDEPRIYNRALSASEIWGLYQAGAADKVNSADTQSAPLERGLAGYWRFDDASGGSAADSSGNGMTGTLTNGPTWTAGRVDGAVDLDGTDDYVSIADNAALDIGTGDFTYSFWLNPDVATQGVFFSDGSYSDGIMFYRYTDNYTYLWLANTYIQTTAWGPTASTWQHVTVRRKSGTVAIYADGVQKYTTGSLTGSINSSSGMRIGYGFAGAANLVLDGRIDEFRMYNRALSDEEIIQLSRLGRPDDPDTGLVGYWPFNGPDIVGTTAYDRSSRGNNGTLTNGPTRAIGKIGQGISFDGTDDYVTMGNAADIGASDASISVWIKLPNSNQAGYIVGKRRDGPSYEQYAVTVGYVNSGGSFVSNKKIGLFFTNDGGLNTTNTQSYYTTNDVADGNWHHAVVVRQNGTTPKIYIDGISMSLTAVFANTNNVNTSNSSALVVGSSGAGSCYATGILDEPRIYNRALTQAEIIALYNAGR